jgi:hypothetical protein
MGRNSAGTGPNLPSRKCCGMIHRRSSLLGNGNRVRSKAIIRTGGPWPTVAAHPSSTLVERTGLTAAVAFEVLAQVGVGDDTNLVRRATGTFSARESPSWPCALHRRIRILTFPDRRDESGSPGVAQSTTPAQGPMPGRLCSHANSGRAWAQATDLGPELVRFRRGLFPEGPGSGHQDARGLIDDLTVGR